MIDYKSRAMAGTSLKKASANELQISSLAYQVDNLDPNESSFDATQAYPPGSIGRRLKAIVFVTDAPFNALGNGEDDYGAFFAALNSGHKAIGIPPGRYRLSQGITVPPGVTLFSDCFHPSSPPDGTILEFDLNVPVCLTIGTTGNSSGEAYGFTVTRAAGIIPAGCYGIRTTGSYASKLRDLASFRHDVPFHFYNNGVGGGIAAIMDNCYTGACTDAHIVQETWAELSLNQCRLGSNGAADQSCNAFIRITGGHTTNAAGGPNTFKAENCQFNQGASVNVNNVIEFVDRTPGAINDFSHWSFDNCYFETFNNFAYVDSSHTGINRFFLSNCNLNKGSTQLVAFESICDLGEWFIDNCKIAGGFNYNSATSNLNGIYISNTMFGGDVNITVPNTGVSYINFSNVSFRAGLSVSGTFSDRSSIKGGQVHGTANLTAAGIGYDIAPFNSASKTWMPSIALGGNNTGITYVRQDGFYTLKDRKVTAHFSIVLSSKGTGTGALTIEGLPFLVKSGSANTSPTAIKVLSASGLSGTPIACPSGSSNHADCYHSSASGITTMTHANLTNTTEITGRVEYRI